ncbi:glyoxylate/succinic semialdehyde reductase 2, chloroplastic-like isoform X1 [Phoenix dactylifera]|uniref:Glyoxylate/succinic semialdehyde reductase 2, chloroplastic-like isoform X1 n=1 Tax=Phoenix dactylifera TaxID=42345 RepID=A0A8B8J0W0_PHODC|nr:glyoxylate/succinic semialdehyde reductase 2, chloroplastic-like isoform X1 [Phoenix dactylifera]
MLFVRTLVDFFCSCLLRAREVEEVGAGEFGGAIGGEGGERERRELTVGKWVKVLLDHSRLLFSSSLLVSTQSNLRRSFLASPSSFCPTISFSNCCSTFPTTVPSQLPDEATKDVILLLGIDQKASVITSSTLAESSKKPAEDGQLIFLASRDASFYETVAPFLDIMGKSRFYLGEVGNGAALKLVFNMIMGSMINSFSEGLLHREKVGLDPNILAEGG